MYADQCVALLARQPVGDRPIILHHQRVVTDPTGKPWRVRRGAEPAGVDQVGAGMQLDGVRQFLSHVAGKLAPVRRLDMAVSRPPFAAQGMRQPSGELRMVVEADHALERRINETVVGGHDQAGVGTFSLGKIPTGSQDPFALRRQALGLVNMIIEAKYHLSLSAIVAKAMDLYGIEDEKARAKMQQDVADFIRLRLKNVLESIRYDVVDAVLADVDDIYAVALRAKAVADYVTDADAAAGVQAFVRVANLAKKAESAEVSADLFQTDAERNLFAAYEKASAAVDSDIASESYAEAITALAALAAPIDTFFDDVMVMDKDEKIKNNRLGLLKSIDQLVSRIADFTKIVLA